MSVADILQAMAQNAGRAQQQRGAILGGAIAGISQIPAQYLADKQREALRLRQQAIQDQQVGFQRNADTRAQSDQDMQVAANAKATKHESIVNAGLSAAIGESGDLTAFDGNAAYKAVSDLGEPSAITAVIAKHREMQAKPVILKEGEQGFNPETNKPIPGLSVPKEKPDYTINGQRFSGDNKPIGSVVPPQLAPKSFQSENDWLVDGKSKPVIFDPGTAKYYANAADILSGTPLDTARMKKKEAATGKTQDALEQEYRTVLARGLSSRSGGLGLEDSKVQQANHLLALLEQTYDPKTDSYAIPKMLQGELAAGLARLVAPGGNVGIEMMREFDQKTAKGDFAGALTYITGHPFPTATQDIAKMLKDSIARQGTVALENREGEMRYLRGLAPTELDEARRLKMEENSLNPLRQSRLIQNTQTGERKLQVSIDGGKTWK